MFAPDLQLTAPDVLRVFHHDEPYLFLGAAFTTVGILAAAFSALRRKWDALLLYFALFAVLYGQRLWVQASLLGLVATPSIFLQNLRTAIDYLVPIPAFLFFNSLGFLSRGTRIAGYTVCVLYGGIAAYTLGQHAEPVCDRGVRAFKCRDRRAALFSGGTSTDAVAARRQGEPD